MSIPTSYSMQLILPASVSQAMDSYGLENPQRRHTTSQLQELNLFDARHCDHLTAWRHWGDHVAVWLKGETWVQTRTL